MSRPDEEKQSWTELDLLTDRARKMADLLEKPVYIRTFHGGPSYNMKDKLRISAVEPQGNEWARKISPRPKEQR